MKKWWLIVSVLACTMTSSVLTRGEMTPSENRPAKPSSGSSMTWQQAVILGVVEGVTEFLPISSTGHLILTGKVLGMGQTSESKAAIDAYDIIIQAGAIFAVVLIYHRRIRQMIMGLLGKDPVGLRLMGYLVLAFLPAAFCGVLLEKKIKLFLFGLWPVVAAWLVGGVVLLLLTGKASRSAGGLSLEGMNLRQALAIGMFQCIALWPGTSRSLAVIVGCLLLGFQLPAAVEFSFLLGLITLGAATTWETLHQGREVIAIFGWVQPAVGFVVAFLAAFLAVKWMIAYLNRGSLSIFGYYRIAIAALCTVVMIWVF